jgi:hypothetical protein
MNALGHGSDAHSATCMLPRRAAHERELARLHRRELARWLCAASAWTLAYEEHGRARARPSRYALGSERYDFGWAGIPGARAPAALNRLRRRAARACALCARDGRDGRDGGAREDEQRLRAWTLSEPARWCSALELAQAAALSCDSALARLRLGQALLCAERPSAARVALQRALGEREPAFETVRARALCQLAEAHEACGADRLALGACVAALELPGAPAELVLHGLFLALCAGDPRCAQRFAAHVALRLAAGRVRDSARAIARLSTRAHELRGGLPWSPPPASARCFDRMLRSGPSSARALLRALAGVAEVPATDAASSAVAAAAASAARGRAN